LILPSKYSKFGIEKQIKMKRKIEDFLRELQPEHAEAALAEFNDSHNVDWRYECSHDGLAESHEQAIWEGIHFGRSNTDWFTIHEQLANGTYIFPSPQESQDQDEVADFDMEAVNRAREVIAKYDRGEYTRAKSIIFPSQEEVEKEFPTDSYLARHTVVSNTGAKEGAQWAIQRVKKLNNQI